MKIWKRIIYRAVAVLSAVAVFTVQLPDLRMKAYAVDPFTAMAGEEVVSYVISAIAAACGVNISSDSSDVAADVRFWVSQAKDDYEIRARVADKEVIKTVAAVSFVRAQEYFQSLADKTFTLVDNGLAVPRDVMDAVSAYFSDRADAYTPSMVSEYSLGYYKGCYFGGMSLHGTSPPDLWGSYYGLDIDIPSTVVCFVIDESCMLLYNASNTSISFTSSTVYCNRQGVVTNGSFTYDMAPGVVKSLRFYYFDTAFSIPVSPYSEGLSYSQSESYVAKVGKELARVSIVDNGILDNAIPSDNWQWSQIENAQTGTAEDVVILQPDAAPTEEELNQRLADAMVLGLLGDLLEQLGIMKKEVEQPPEPSSSEEESSEPAIVPTDPPVPSESPSESLDPDPGVDPDPDVKPDLSLSQAVQAVEGFFQGISAKLDLLLNPFTQENMEKRKLKEVVMTRFPFCVPFDLIDCFRMFEETSVEPRWEIPFDFPSVGVHYVLVLDLTQFTDLVALVRVFVLLSYIGGLILVTRALIKG